MSKQLVRSAAHRANPSVLAHWYNDGTMEVQGRALPFGPSWSSDMFLIPSWPDIDPAQSALVYHNHALVFRNRFNVRQQGWCVANVYRYGGRFIGVLSEKFYPNGNYNDGPNDQYGWSLTNAMLYAPDRLVEDLGRTLDSIIHYTPARRDEAHQLALVQARYSQRLRCHVGERDLWLPIGDVQFQTWVGVNVLDVPLGEKWPTA